MGRDSVGIECQAEISTNLFGGGTPFVTCETDMYHGSGAKIAHRTIIAEVSANKEVTTYGDKACVAITRLLAIAVEMHVENLERNLDAAGECRDVLKQCRHLVRW